MTILRILFVVLAFGSWGGLIPLYFVASWIIPSARPRNYYDDSEDDYQEKWNRKAQHFDEKMDRWSERYSDKMNNWARRYEDKGRQTNGEIHGMNQKVVRLRKHNQLKKKKKMTGQISKKVTDRKFCQ